MNVISFKMMHRSRLFNKGQRVFVITTTGDEAVWCYGRHRGKNRWIKAWVTWGTKTHPAPTFQEFEVADDCHIARMCGHSDAWLERVGRLTGQVYITPEEVQKLLIHRINNDLLEIRRELDNGDN